MVDVEQTTQSGLPTLVTVGKAIKDAPGANNIFLAYCTTANNITTCVGHGFSSGDHVQYDALDGATAITGLTDGGAYYVLKVNDYEVQLTNAWAQVSSLAFARHADGDTITRPSGSWVDAGFAAGQTITISGTFLGSNDRTLTILSLPSATVIKVVEHDVVAVVTDFSSVTVAAGALSLANAWAQVAGLVFSTDATGDTITRSSGSWADAGFAAGQTIKISGTLLGPQRPDPHDPEPAVGERDQGRRARRRRGLHRSLQRHGDDLAHGSEAVGSRRRTRRTR